MATNTKSRVVGLMSPLFLFFDIDMPSVPLLLKNGKPKEGWVRVALPDLIKRRKVLVRTGVREESEFETFPPPMCRLKLYVLFFFLFFFPGNNLHYLR